MISSTSIPSVAYPPTASSNSDGIQEEMGKTMQPNSQQTMSLNANGQTLSSAQGDNQADPSTEPLSLRGGGFCCGCFAGMLACLTCGLCVF